MLTRQLFFNLLFHRAELFTKVTKFLDTCRADQLQKRIAKMNADKENKPAAAKKQKMDNDQQENNSSCQHAKRALDLSGDNTFEQKTK